jgi:hypothetical protein
VSRGIFQNYSQKISTGVSAAQLAIVQAASKHTNDLVFTTDTGGAFLFINTKSYPGWQIATFA